RFDISLLSTIRPVITGMYLFNSYPLNLLNSSGNLLVQFVTPISQLSVCRNFTLLPADLALSINGWITVLRNSSNASGFKWSRDNPLHPSLVVDVRAPVHVHPYRMINHSPGGAFQISSLPLK